MFSINAKRAHAAAHSDWTVLASRLATDSRCSMRICSHACAYAHVRTCMHASACWRSSGVLAVLCFLHRFRRGLGWGLGVRTTQVDGDVLDEGQNLLSLSFPARVSFWRCKLPSWLNWVMIATLTKVLRTPSQTGVRAARFMMGHQPDLAQRTYSKGLY